MNPAADWLSLNQLPQEILLSIVAKLPEAEWITTLPLVSKNFCQLMRLPSSYWKEVRYVRSLKGASKLIDGPGFCKWLRPRLAGLHTFCCAVDTLTLRDDDSLTAMLLPILPSTLKQLRLQCSGVDRSCEANSKTCTSQFGPAFKLEQDAAPHLAALTRLSSLQQLSLPLHSSLGSASVECLAALTALQELEMVWRYPEVSTAPQAGEPGASLSNLLSLTSLKLSGIRGTCIDGLAMLPQLQELHISGCRNFSMTSAAHATSLTSLTFLDVEFWQPASATLQMLYSMTPLEDLGMFECQMTPPSAAAPMEFACLLELAGLRSLKVSETGGLQYEKQPQRANFAHGLSMLNFSVQQRNGASEIPGLMHMAHLKELMISVNKPVACFKPPTGLSSLHSLVALKIFMPVNGVQRVDITPLNDLASTIESIDLIGSVKLVASGTLLQLAAQPRLKRVMLGWSFRTCSISSQGATWLHCASFFHALLNRPLSNLPAVYLCPDVSRY